MYFFISPRVCVCIAWIGGRRFFFFFWKSEEKTFEREDSNTAIAFFLNSWCGRWRSSDLGRPFRDRFAVDTVSVRGRLQLELYFCCFCCIYICLFVVYLVYFRWILLYFCCFSLLYLCCILVVYLLYIWWIFVVFLLHYFISPQGGYPWKKANPRPTWISIPNGIKIRRWPRKRLFLAHFLARSVIGERVRVKGS